MALQVMALGLQGQGTYDCPMNSKGQAFLSKHTSSGFAAVCIDMDTDVNIGVAICRGIDIGIDVGIDTDKDIGIGIDVGIGIGIDMRIVIGDIHKQGV